MRPDAVTADNSVRASPIVHWAPVRGRSELGFGIPHACHPAAGDVYTPLADGLPCRVDRLIERQPRVQCEVVDSDDTGFVDAGPKDGLVDEADAAAGEATSYSSATGEEGEVVEGAEGAEAPAAAPAAPSAGTLATDEALQALRDKLSGNQ